MTGIFIVSPGRPMRQQKLLEFEGFMLGING